MVETNITCMDAIEPKTKWIHPLGYEVEEHILEAYVQVILLVPKDPNEPRWGTYEEKTRQVDAVLNNTTTKRKASKITSEVLKIHGVTQDDLDKEREAKIAMQLLESTPSSKEKIEKTDDPKEKKVKIEKIDDPKEKKNKTIDSTLVPTPTIDLESTPPLEYSMIPKRKNKKDTNHPSSRTTRSQRKITQAPPEVEFKLNLQVLRSRIIEGRIEKISKFYDKYSEIDKSEIHCMIIKHMIKFKKIVLELKTIIPNSVWNILRVFKETCY